MCKNMWWGSIDTNVQTVTNIVPNVYNNLQSSFLSLAWPWPGRSLPKGNQWECWDTGLGPNVVRLPVHLPPPMHPYTPSAPDTLHPLCSPWYHLYTTWPWVPTLPAIPKGTLTPLHPLTAPTSLMAPIPLTPYNPRSPSGPDATYTPAVPWVPTLPTSHQCTLTPLHPVTAPIPPDGPWFLLTLPTPPGAPWCHLFPVGLWVPTFPASSPNASLTPPTPPDGPNSSDSSNASWHPLHP